MVREESGWGSDISATGSILRRSEQVASMLTDAAGAEVIDNSGCFAELAGGVSPNKHKNGGFSSNPERAFAPAFHPRARLAARSLRHAGHRPGAAIARPSCQPIAPTSSVESPSRRDRKSIPDGKAAHGCDLQVSTSAASKLVDRITQQLTETTTRARITAHCPRSNSMSTTNKEDAP